MPDTTVPDPLRDYFEIQAKACEQLGSPFTAKLCRLLIAHLDDTTRTGRRVLSWPGDPRADALALRLCGGLHALVLSGADEALQGAYPPNAVDDTALQRAVLGALDRHDERLAASLDSPPQTNEIARAAMLLPGFLAIGRDAAMSIAVHEIGSSAGLNLLFDRFHYTYGDTCWGDDASPVRLAPEVRGTPPPLGGFLDIASRKGSDIAPVDVARPESRLRLRSFVWPDQAARLERLDAAFGLAAQHPFSLERADAADFVERALAAREDGRVFVLFHSIMWQYMPEATRLRIETALDEAGNRPGAAPVAWLRMEPLVPIEGHATLSLTQWPGGETRHLAKCDYHGRWIEWTA